LRHTVQYIMDSLMCIYRALVGQGHVLPGLSRISAGDDCSGETSLAALLIQYCWTHWDEPVDVCINFLYLIQYNFVAVSPRQKSLNKAFVCMELLNICRITACFSYFVMIM